MEEFVLFYEKETNIFFICLFFCLSVLIFASSEMIVMKLTLKDRVMEQYIGYFYSSILVRLEFTKFTQEK